MDTNGRCGVNNKSMTDWALISLMIGGGAAAAALYALKSVAVLWFQSMAQTSQVFLG